LYDLAIDSAALCESARVPVKATIYTPLETPQLMAAGDTKLCPGDSVTLMVANACPDCIITWSNGATGTAIKVADPGAYTATMTNPLAPLCGASPVSEAIILTENAAPTEAPSVQPSGNGPLCPGTTLVLSIAQICPDCQVRWSDGSVTDSLTVSTAGIYSAAFENVCGMGPISEQVEVSALDAPPTPVLSASGTTSLCPGESLSLALTNVCADCQVLWNTGSDAQALDISQTGAYTVTQSNVCGVSAASDTFFVISLDLPTAPEFVLDGSTALCPGESLTVTIANPCLGCETHWSNGATGLQQLLNSAGMLTATQMNACGESQISAVVEATEKLLPEAPVIQANGLTIFCEGDSVLLSAAFNCPDCQFSWSNGATTANLMVNESGMFTASLSNECGAGPTSDPVWVSEQPLLPAPEIAVLGNTALCPGDTAVLQVLSSVCPGCEVHWSDGTTGISRLIAEAGIFSASLLDPNSVCGAGLSSNAIAITLLPEFTPQIQLEGACQLSAPAGANYKWYFNGQPISGANSSVWEADTAGFFSVSMTGPDGCSGVSAPVFAEACISRTFAPFSEIQADIYPNPAHTSIYLSTDFQEASEVQFDLYSTDGRLVSALLQSRFSEGKQVQEIHLPELPDGAYLCRMVTEWGIWQELLLIRK
ncbi:MAG: T9SS type A sorting domain-containing protein, partial [Saprospiraceae bacterium]|nr:T9SS type A sorting domain-containing protein [Saprospiraceae bacterium]